MNTIRLFALAAIGLQALWAQPTADQESSATSTAASPVTDKRAYGVLPNYRTAELSAPFASISAGRKFTIAAKDSLDGPSYILGGFFAGLAQFNNTNPSFGQGVKGYAHRYATALADQDIGNFMTEAILPSLLHEDPRFFRRGQGSPMKRALYAASRVAITRTDSGGQRFNTSEFLGNGMVASLGNAYYPDGRGFSDTMQRMFTQIGTDAISNVLKEFWPDVKKKFMKKSAEPSISSRP